MLLFLVSCFIFCFITGNHIFLIFYPSYLLQFPGIFDLYYLFIHLFPKISFFIQYFHLVELKVVSVVFGIFYYNTFSRSLVFHRIVYAFLFVFRCAFPVCLMHDLTRLPDISKTSSICIPGNLSFGFQNSDLIISFGLKTLYWNLFVILEIQPLISCIYTNLYSVNTLMSTRSFLCFFK